jgi:hypothetical protein
MAGPGQPAAPRRAGTGGATFINGKLGERPVDEAAEVAQPEAA